MTMETARNIGLDLSLNTHVCMWVLVRTRRANHMVRRRKKGREGFQRRWEKDLVRLKGFTHFQRMFLVRFMQVYVSTMRQS